MKRFAIFCTVGLGILFGALAPTFTPTPASAYYYHHRYYPYRYHGHYYRYRYHHHYYNHRRVYHHRYRYW